MRWANKAGLFVWRFLLSAGVSRNQAATVPGPVADADRAEVFGMLFICPIEIHCGAVVRDQPVGLKCALWQAECHYQVCLQQHKCIVVFCICTQNGHELPHCCKTRYKEWLLQKTSGSLVGWSGVLPADSVTCVVWLYLVLQWRLCI